MAANDFAVFNLDGTAEFVLPPPQQVTWEQPVIGETFTRQPIYDFYKTVSWAWGGPLHVDYYNALVNLRTAEGLLRFRTKNRAGQFVQCIGTCDMYPSGTMKDGAWYGVAVVFWRVEEVA